MLRAGLLNKADNYGFFCGLNYDRMTDAGPVVCGNNNSHFWIAFV